MIKAKNDYPLISKLVSIVFFGGMGLLVLSLFVDKRLDSVLLIMLQAVSLVSWAGTYLLFIWLGYRGFQIGVMSGRLQDKSKFLVENVKPFIFIPIVALGCGCLLLVTYGFGQNYVSIIAAMVIVLPLTSTFFGVLFALLARFLK